MSINGLEVDCSGGGTGCLATMSRDICDVTRVSPIGNCPSPVLLVRHAHVGVKLPRFSFNINLIDDRCHAAALLLISSLPLPLISTLNVQPSSTTPMKLMKKVGDLRNRIFGTKKDSSSNRRSTDTEPGAHDPGPGNDTGSTEPTASGKLCHLRVIDNDSTFLQASMLP